MSDVFRRAYTNPLGVGPSSMVASAEKMTGSLLDHLIQNRGWQKEGWDFYHAMGEFWYGVTWLSNACSRVRLVAAKKQPGGDEPEVINSEDATGADAEVVRFVEELGGGVGGRSAILKSLAVQLSVPGEGYVVGEQKRGEDDKLSKAEWSVKSSDELRRRSSADDTRKKPSILKGIAPTVGRADSSPFEIQVEEGRWRPLEPESLVCRIWQPDEQYSWRAVSAALPALAILRELDLINRRILAELVSRIAMNGMLVIPQEATFPVRPEFADAADPFVEELIENASRAIKTPGSASAAIPFPIRVPAEFADKFMHIKFSEYLDPKLMEARDRTIKRLATTLNMPSEVLLGVADVNHWCTDNETEVMSRHGWISQSELSVGDEVLTLNHDTGLSEWQPVQDIYRADVENFEMVRMEGQNHSSVTTPNHRWPVIDQYGNKSFVHSENLTRQHRITTGALSIELPTDAKWSDSLVELIAWFWTEGHVSKKGSPRICIAQSHSKNPEKVARIRNALTQLFGPCVERLHGHADTPAWREKQLLNHSGAGGSITMFYLNVKASHVLVEHAPRKIVTLDFIQQLTQSQLQLFIDVSIMGDGKRKDDILQLDPRMLDAMEFAYILLGRMVTTRPDSERYTRLHAWTQSLIAPVKAAMTGGYSNEGSQGKMQITRGAYTGMIWCPVTPNGTWLARRRGTVYYTGNTAWQIDESGIKLHISPLIEVICSGLTLSYLQPMIEASGVSIADGSEYVIWYDISELTTHPDLSQNGKDAYDRGEISGIAYRREAGFSEDDAPDEEELKQLVLLKLALAGNTTAIGQLFPDLEEAMAPAPTPGYDPETGRPLAPEPPPGTPAQVGNQESGPAKSDRPGSASASSTGSNGRVPAGA